MKKNIVLIGMRGAGKSTTGKILAEKLNWNFVDLDSEIEIIKMKSIKSIFELKGKKHFREIEKEVFLKNIDKENCVISTGGGVVLIEDIEKNLKNSFVINLFGDIETLIDRVKTGSRPPLTDYPLEEEMKLIYNKRKILYFELGNLSVDTSNLTPEEVANVVKHSWKLF
jgi:shikimate kinase